MIITLSNMLTMSIEEASEQVYLYIFWKSAIKFDGSTIDTKLILKKNNILYKIVTDKFGTFPKKLSDFEKIEKDFMNITDNTKDLIMAFVYSGGTKKIMISHDSDNTEKYTKYVLNYLSGSPGYKVIYDKVAMRNNNK